MTLAELKSALPESKLRHGAQWLFSPEPFRISKKEAREVDSLGHSLAMFQKASESIYQRSALGRLPEWIADLLDTGKPDWMVKIQRSVELRDSLPRVIRPDLILTDRETTNGYALTELDSVPGGMGIATWLSQVYTAHGFEVFGGANGIADGFKSLMPDGGKILVSEESADYLPEMSWLAEQLGEGYEAIQAEADDVKDDADRYRFFEWFDWQNIPQAKKLASRTNLTSPCKPHLEEKLWLALLWSPALKELWEKEMRGSHLKRVRDVVPFGWPMDPTPLPPHAALPRLGVNSWTEVGEFSQKDRRLVAKISGFNELAWGSKSVTIGHDLSGDDWSAAIETASNDFSTQPWMMQQYQSGRVVEHPYFDEESGEVKIMKGRVRLCPYYFIDAKGKTKMGGTMATIVPADKKKIHGMRDGILVPCMVEE